MFCVFQLKREAIANKRRNIEIKVRTTLSITRATMEETK
jgi:hypothetical protein